MYIPVRTPSKRTTRSLLLVLMLIMAILCLSIAAFAQSSDPPAPGGRSLSEHISGLSIRANQLLPLLQNEVIVHLADWFARMSLILAALVMILSFARTWRENDGAGINLLWWFVRLGVCLAVLGSSQMLLTHLHALGKQIAVGDEIAGKSVLYEFYTAQRGSFNDSYSKMSEGTFTVRVDGNDFPVAPTNGSEAFLGVLFDTGATVKDINNRLNDSSWTLTALYSWLNVSRGILEFGDFWLIGLASILLMIFKVVAPFMVVLAVDQKLAHKVSYPFAWGTVVLTLVWPSVSYFIRGIAYLFGNLAMALGDTDPLYTWDQATLQAIKTPLMHPVYTVAIAAFFMTIAGLCLWVSPYIAYRLSMGQVYEGVSSTVSSWAGAIIGTAVEAYSTVAAASINQQASNTQASAAYQADTTRAGGEFKAATRAADSKAILARSQVTAGREAALSAIYGNLHGQTSLLRAQGEYTRATIAEGATLAQAHNLLGTGQGIFELKQQAAQTKEGIEADYTDRKLRNIGATVDRLGFTASASGPLASGAGASAQLFGIGIDAMANHGGNRISRDRKVGALDNATRAIVESRQSNADQKNVAQEINKQRLIAAQDKYVSDATAGANKAAGISVAGVNRSASIQFKGISESVRVEKQGIQERYDSQVKAAGVTRDASVEAARLHALSSVLSRLGSRVARDIEKGLEMRF